MKFKPCAEIESRWRRREHTRSMATASALLLYLLVADGCAAAPAWQFREATPRLDKLGPLLHVMATVDSRESAEIAAPWLRWLPGVNWTSWGTTHPERAAANGLNAAQATTAALATLAREARTYRAVTMEGETTASGPGMTLAADLRELRVTRRSQNYYLGAAALPLWLFGAPCGGQQTTFELAVTLRDESGALVWQDALFGTRDRMVGLYYNFDWRECSFDDLDSLLRESWRQVLRRLRAKVREES